METRTEAACNDMTECSHVDQYGMFDFADDYLHQGEHREHWRRLSNRFFCVCLSVHMMTHNAAAPA